MYRSTKFRSKELGIPFDLEMSDLVLPARCPVLGIPFEIGEGSPIDASPSLDKYIPELGYVKGNVHIISFKANRMKNDGTLREVKLLVKWMERVEDGEYDPSAFLEPLEFPQLNYDCQGYPSELRSLLD